MVSWRAVPSGRLGGVLRLIFTLASAVSLLVCVAAAVLWVRSYWVVDRYGFSPLHSVATDRGSLVFCRIDPDLNLMVERGYHRDPAPNPTSGWNPRQAARRTWNLFVAHGEDFPGFKMVVIELWPPVLLTGMVFTLWLRREVALRRRAFAGRCSRCGYDLRATPNRCPECGHIAEGATS